MNKIKTYGKEEILVDLIVPNLNVIFCGTAAGPNSARTNNYYSNKGNKFYAVLADVGLTTSQIKPENFYKLVNYGIGLTDLSKHAYGTDNQIIENDYDTMHVYDLTIKYSPKILAFNGKNAAKEFLERWVDYGEQNETVGTTKLFVLPSTSGKAASYWDQSYWSELAQTVINKTKGNNNE
jgi:TDG/mug DNA glycosylase family protein